MKAAVFNVALLSILATVVLAGFPGLSFRQDAAVDGPEGMPDGGGGALFEPASDQCLTSQQYNDTIPTSFDAYPSCFQYKQNDDGTATVYMTGVPDHVVYLDVPENGLCFTPKKYTLPKPVKTNVNKQVPQRGAIGISVNGVYLFGALEGGGGNAVDGSSGITVLCSGHPQPSGNWHYHNPSVACKEAATDELVGWALDGFPIYGAIAGSKEDADALLDECNGRDVDDSYGYRYHVRTREQVDETLTDNAGPNNTENWKYFLGCYKGETAVTEDDAEDIDFTEACVDGKSTQILGIDSSTATTASVSLVTEGPETTPSSPYEQATTTTASSEGCN